jgi:histidine triad (HIT) family protein
MSCIFCDIVAGEAEAFVVASDPRAVAFLDINPLTTGHTLVVPTRHVRDLLDGGAEAVTELAPVLEETARLLMGRLDADGVNVFQSSGAAAGQEVFHLHMHLLPRWRGDGVLKDLVGTSSSVDDLDKVHQLLAT